MRRSCCVAKSGIMDQPASARNAWAVEDSMVSNLKRQGMDW